MIHCKVYCCRMYAPLLDERREWRNQGYHSVADRLTQWTQVLVLLYVIGKVLSEPQGPPPLPLHDRIIEPTS